jgi:hypothetical protein
MARQKKPFDAVQFTRESAERVARVVRQAELTPAAASPLTFDRRLSDRVPKQVRAATFSGAWPTGSSKVVTFKYAPTATANVVNLSWPITLSGYVNEDCIVGKEGTNWWLVVPKLETSTAVFVTQTQQLTFCSQTSTQSVITSVTTSGQTITSISDVSVTASLNTNSCNITVGVTKTSDSRNFVTGVTANTARITVVSQTATAVFIAATATSSYLRLRLP